MVAVSVFSDTPNIQGDIWYSTHERSFQRQFCELVSQSSQIVMNPIWLLIVETLHHNPYRDCGYLSQLLLYSVDINLPCRAKSKVKKYTACQSLSVYRFNRRGLWMVSLLISGSYFFFVWRGSQKGWSTLSLFWKWCFHYMGVSHLVSAYVSRMPDSASLAVQVWWSAAPFTRDLNIRSFSEAVDELT